MNRLYKHLNANETLRSMLPKLKEVFLMFYGEENRKHIDNLFDNTILIGYQDENDLLSIIHDIKEDKSKELVTAILNKFNIPTDEKTAKNYFGAAYGSLDFVNISPVKEVYEYLEQFKLGKEQRIENVRKNRYERIAQYLRDLSYEDFLNNNITDEQLSHLPQYYKNLLMEWNNDQDLDKDFTRAKNTAVLRLSEIFPEVDKDNIDEFTKEGKFDIIIALYNELLDKEAIFKDYCKENLSDISDLVLKQKEYKRELEKKYFIKFVEQFKSLLSEKDIEAFDKEKQKSSPWFYSIDGIKVIFGSGLGSVRDIGYFSSECEEMLHNPEVGDYTKKTIMESRIKYFKYVGIDLGDNYEDYVNNPDCKNLWPSEQTIIDLNTAASNIEDELNKEFYSSLPFYKEIQEKITSLGLLDKEAVFEPSNYVKRMTCVTPNIVQNGQGYTLLPQLLIYACNSDFLDARIIHEFNHLYELALLNASDGKYSCICGWDIVESRYNQSIANQESTIDSDEEKRPYELFNEAINEMIAQDIAIIMHEQGIYLFCDKEHCKDTGGTSYQNMFFLVRDFYNEYKDAILESRKNGRIDIIYEKVGKENFEELNSLISEFRINFPEFTYYQTVLEMESGEETPLTQKFNQILERRNIILNNMREYSRRPTIFDK